MMIMMMTTPRPFAQSSAITSNLVACCATIAFDGVTIGREDVHPAIAEAVQGSRQFRIAVKGEHPQVRQEFHRFRDGPAEVVVVESEFDVGGGGDDTVVREQVVERSGQGIFLQVHDVEELETGHAGRHSAAQLVGIQRNAFQFVQQAQLAWDSPAQAVVAQSQGRGGMIRKILLVSACSDSVPDALIVVESLPSVGPAPILSARRSE
mmetsp:Transcript_25094/g.70371  ORF Transcript_25094/g.70371 Transcript_25094/m.70371 type:complete len:208 (+) Transcript_25094:311-934(+)